MASESSLFDDYGAYHRDRRNVICHEIGIPLIVLGIIALLRLVALPGWNLNLATLALVATALYYLTLGSAVRTVGGRRHRRDDRAVSARGVPDPAVRDRRVRGRLDLPVRRARV